MTTKIRNNSNYCWISEESYYLCKEYLPKHWIPILFEHTDKDEVWLYRPILKECDNTARLQRDIIDACSTRQFLWALSLLIILIGFGLVCLLDDFRYIIEATLTTALLINRQLVIYSKNTAKGHCAMLLMKELTALSK